MKKYGPRPAPALDVRGLTLGQVLEKTARAAGLRLVVEDGVVWLRE